MATWIDWKGKLPTGYQAARRTRENRSLILGDNLHVISDGRRWKRTDEENGFTRGADKVWRTLCGVEVEDTTDEENWRTEQELSDYDLPPFPDDMKVCRICNARKRGLPTGGE